MNKIKVMVVDDSAFMRKVVADMLQHDPDIEVIERARNGREAIEKVKQLAPDVLTLDVEMPEMNGLETLDWLMKNHPVPVVMLSSLTQQGADTTIKALERGAVDFVSKPSGSISLDINKVENELIQKVKTAAKMKRIRPRIPPVHPVHPVQPGKRLVSGTGSKQTSHLTNLVLVGTSTGGPRALQHFLSPIPPDINAAFLIVQHMPPGFTRSLAERLDSLYPLKIVEAKQGQRIENGIAYIAPGDYHMKVEKDAGGRPIISLSQDPPRGGHRPSVDVMFESAEKLADINKYIVIMTGMGSDGTAGLTRLQESGVKMAIAEDESTCVVYGMPRAAIQSGHIDHILPLPDISKFLIDQITRPGGV
ncbi:MAG: chemotaxis response regulator protein-glutamate methylesterase [Bacillaceae bacterium]|nr:chemotaxis response regulator protein-glutamate methylesterase [Bacillaceae bacterium]